MAFCGLTLYAVGVTVNLQMVGAAICAASLGIVVFASAVEIVRSLRKK